MLWYSQQLRRLKRQVEPQLEVGVLGDIVRQNQGVTAARAKELLDSLLAEAARKEAAARRLLRTTPLRRGWVRCRRVADSPGGPVADTDELRRALYAPPKGRP